MILKEQMVQYCIVAKKVYPENYKGDHFRITNSRDGHEVARAIQNEETLDYLESFFIIMLNRSNRVIGYKLVSTGGVNGTTVDSNVVFAAAILAGAKGLVLVHNHPSGNVNPSESDIQVTRQLKAGGRVLEIQVIDHIILAGDSYTSLADQGLMR